ncbi:hypothetical protein ACFYPK_22015 [Streptomyces halstedii]|uniref:hypothetical protein n=1 Tax=Streptomyces TaxID=1883 RepID=UPI001F5221FF|nr:hypothetical protein [Streptomyces sp. NTK 937]
MTVKVNNDRDAAAKAFLAQAAKHGAAVDIVRGQEKLEPKAAIYPGSKMTPRAGDAARGRERARRTGRCVRPGCVMRPTRRSRMARTGERALSPKRSAGAFSSKADSRITSGSQERICSVETCGESAAMSWATLTPPASSSSGSCSRSRSRSCSRRRRP